MTIITNNIFDDSNQLLRDRYSQHMVAFPASYTDEDLPYIDISTKPNILYVHIPFCSGKCHYCSYVTKTPKDFSEVDNYLSYLEKEAKLLYEKNNHKPEIKSIYIGGGTPSILNIDQLKVLFKILDTYFDLSDLKEYTLEGCPETYSYEKAMFAKDNGITRASIGVESFDDHILRNMNRRHDSKDAKQVINDILSAGLELDIDLITCYPGYTEDKIIKDLEIINEHKPTSVSTYKYTVKPSSVDYKHHDPLLSREEVLKQSLFWYEGLQKIGYHQRSVDWFFVDPEKRFVHQDYKLSCESNHLVLGVSGYGIMGDTQYYNHKSTNEYFKSLNENKLPVDRKQKLSANDLAKRRLMFGVRNSLPISFNFPEPKKIQWLLENKLLVLENDYYSLTSTGQLFINEIQEHLAN
tara:strand:- start:2399 stop:3625 length:1227 start_codon:yes stop_codon:yes gene_type:complete